MPVYDLAVPQLVARAAVRAFGLAMRDIDENARMRIPACHFRIRAIHGEVFCADLYQRHLFYVRHRTANLEVADKGSVRAIVIHTASERGGAGPQMCPVVSICRVPDTSR